MYHLQGVCKFAAGGCAFAHSTEELNTARARKGRRGGKASTGMSHGGPSGNARKRSHDTTSALEQYWLRKGCVFQPSTLSQPAYIPYNSNEGSLAQRGSAHSQTSVFHGPGFPGVSHHTQAPMRPPPGLEPTPCSPWVGLGSFLPPASLHQPQNVCLADMTQATGEQTGAGKLEECAFSGDELPITPGMSQNELNQISNLVRNVQRALLMTPPKSGVDFGVLSNTPARVAPPAWSHPMVRSVVAAAGCRD